MASEGAATTPRRFGDYTLERLLGKGGMGHVWLARAHGNGGVERPCVVKTLLAQDDPEYQRRFVDEARLLVLLSHPNICAVFDAGCVDGRYYLAMEHIDGRDLKEVLRLTEGAGTPLPLPITLYIVKEVLAALDAAHRMTHPLTQAPLKVVHRDVSPQNVMVSVDGRVKLIDFGLALSTQKVEKTAPRIVMGKLAYMAPEHARGDSLDGRADQFAVGVLLYELLGNERYYAGLGTDELWRMSGVGGFRPAKLRSLPPALRAIVERATSPAREDRFPDCGAMYDALVAFEHAQGVAATAVDAEEALAALGTDPGFGAFPTGERARPTLLAGAHPAVSGPDDVAPPREKTRTFRIRTVGADVVVEGLEPTVEAPPPSRAEPTQIVRPTARSPSLSSPSPSSSPSTAPSSRRRVAVAAAVVAVVALGLALGLRGGGAAPSLPAPDAGGAGRDATALVVAVDAGVAAGAVADAGVAAAAVVAAVTDAGVVVDAGAAAGVVDAGSAVVDAEARARAAPRRAVPPLPRDSVLKQVRLLNEHCADVPCTGRVGALLRPGGPSPAEVTRALRACYAACQRQPR